MAGKDELKKLQTLLDQGAISKEQFELLKEQMEADKPAAKKATAKTGKSASKTGAEKKADTQKKKSVTKSPGAKETSKVLADSKKTEKKENVFVSDISSIPAFIVLALLIIAFVVLVNLDAGSWIGFILFILGGAIYWLFRIGRRNGIFFFLPYLVFITGTILWVEAPEGMRDNNVKDHVEGLEKGIYWVFIIVAFLAFLLEYFLAQPKCAQCKSRIWMKRTGESGHDSYSYMSTKTYDIRSKSGEKVGEYDGPVHRTTYTFTGHYFCRKCGGMTYRGESETYDN